jgi:hypothetical protein
VAITIITMQDVIDHLVDVAYGNVGDKGLRLFKRAARMGYRELREIHDWRYFLREFVVKFDTATEGTTGVTIAYDHTGGSSERLVTISGTTFPTWLASYPRHGRIDIAGDVFEVDQYLTTTTCTLREGINPGADVNSTTDWKLYRGTYPLDDDFGGMFDLVEQSNPCAHFYIEPEEWHAQERAFNIGGEPFAWTVMADPDREGGFVIRVVGYPTSADLLSFIYRSRGTDPAIAGDETKASAGTVELTSGSATVAGTSTTFDSTMVGAVLRVSSTATAPTGPEGTNPFAEQGIIRAVASTTSLSLRKNASQSLAAGKAYVISSLLDCEPGAMLNALFMAAEYHLSALLQEDTKIAGKRARFLEAVRLAMSQDSKLKMMRVSGQGYGYSMAMGDGMMFGNPNEYEFGDNL